MKKDKIEHLTLMDEAERTMDLPTWVRVALNLKEILGPDLIHHIGWKYLKMGDYHWRLYHEERHHLYDDHVNYVVNYFSDKTGRFLDVGCGEGLILSLLNSQTELVCSGIDSSPLAIMFAHQRGVMNCECADLFSYNEARYDFIFVGDVLEHLDHPELALKKMKDLLAPNGVLLVSTPVQGDEPECGDKYVLAVDKVLEMMGNELNIINHETQQAWLKNYFLATKGEEAMGSITPKDVHDRKLVYRKHQKHFEKQGFSYSIACKLFPIIQQSVWDMFGLFCYAKEIPDGGTYMELGSKWGGSLACVFYASQVAGHKIRMIGVEPQWQKLTLLRKFAKEHDVRLIGGYSHGAASKIKNDSIDFLFIDGPHNYQTVSVDLKDYWPKIKAGGFVVGHDYTDKFPGVAEAVQEFFGKNYTVLPHSTIYVAKKEIPDEERQAQIS